MPKCWTKKSRGGDPCVSPFWSGGKKHEACTWANAFSNKNGKPWCATVNTKENHTYSNSDWGDCANLKDECDVEGNHHIVEVLYNRLHQNYTSYLSELDKCRTEETTDGVACVFPFLYDGRFFDNCTWTNAYTERSGKPWCAITKTTDGQYEDSEWGNCADNCQIEGNH